MQFCFSVASGHKSARFSDFNSLGFNGRLQSTWEGSDYRSTSMDSFSTQQLQELQKSPRKVLQKAPSHEDFLTVNNENLHSSLLETFEGSEDVVGWTSKAGSEIGSTSKSGSEIGSTFKSGSEIGSISRSGSEIGSTSKSGSEIGTITSNSGSATSPQKIK